MTSGNQLMIGTAVTSTGYTDGIGEALTCVIAIL